MGRLLMKGGGTIAVKETKSSDGREIVFYPDTNFHLFRGKGVQWYKDKDDLWYFIIPNNSSILALPELAGLVNSVRVDDGKVLTALSKSNEGATELSELRQLLIEGENKQQEEQQEWAEYIQGRTDLAQPIIRKIALLASQGMEAAKSWKKDGIEAPCRQQYINEFCRRERGGGAMTARDEIKLRLLLNYLPNVVYRCFGCRHDFYDNATAMRSYEDDLMLFCGAPDMTQQELYSLFHSLLGPDWTKFYRVLYGRTCNTKKLEVAWEDLQSSIYDWINTQPSWGLLWQDVPITMSLPRLSGEGENERQNIKLTRARLNALDHTLIPRLVGVFDINKEPMKSVCPMLINMGGVGEIDGAPISFTGAVATKVVASVNPRLSVPCGAFAVGADVKPMYFYCPTADEKHQLVVANSGAITTEEEKAWVLSHEIFIFRGAPGADNLLATCPTRIGVNQINANTVEEGGVVAGSAWRNKATAATANSCNIWFNTVLVTTSEKKQEIMQAAKAAGDFFCKYISEQIQQEGTLREAITKGVLLEATVTDEQKNMMRIVCINQTGDGLCDKECTSSGLASCFAFKSRIEISVPAYLCGDGDIKPILIKEFALKLGDFQIFLGLSDSLTRVIDTITNRLPTLVAQIQFYDSIKKLNAFLQKTKVSSEYIMRILEALTGDDIPTALTLMKQNNRKISFNISEVIDGIFGEIRENDGKFPTLVVSWRKESMPECASYEVSFEDIVESGVAKLKKSLNTTKGKLWGDDHDAAVPLIRYVNMKLYSDAPKDRHDPFMKAVNSALTAVKTNSMTAESAIAQYLPGGEDPSVVYGNNGTGSLDPSALTTDPVSLTNQQYWTRVQLSNKPRLPQKQKDVMTRLCDTHRRFPTTMDILNEFKIKPKLFLETIGGQKQSNNQQSENMLNQQQKEENKPPNEDSNWERKIIDDKNALIGARIFADVIARRPTEETVPEIPVGVIGDLVTYLTTEEILQRFNKEKVLEVLDDIMKQIDIGMLNHQDIKRLCKYLSYLTLSLRIRFDNDNNELIVAIPFLIIDALGLDIDDAPAILLVHIIQGMNDTFNTNSLSDGRWQAEQICIQRFQEHVEYMQNPFEWWEKEEEQGRIFQAAVGSVETDRSMASHTLTHTHRNLWYCIDLMQEVNREGFLTVDVTPTLVTQRENQLKQEEEEKMDQFKNHQRRRRSVMRASNSSSSSSSSSSSTPSSSVQVAVALSEEGNGEANPRVGVSVESQARPPKGIWRKIKSWGTAKTGYTRKRGYKRISGGTKKKRTRRKRKKTRRKKKRKKKTIRKRRKRGRKTRHK